jgi:hypothetical protein
MVSKRVLTISLHVRVACRCGFTCVRQYGQRTEISPGGGQEPHHQLGQYISLFEQLAFDTL